MAIKSGIRNKSSKRYSLRIRLAAWLLIPTLIVCFLVLYDGHRAILETVNTISDKILAGAAVAIADRVVLGESGSLEVDVPRVAFDMLTSVAQDRVFYRIEDMDGTFITGHELLTLPKETKIEGQETVFVNSTFQLAPFRAVIYTSSLSSGETEIKFRTIVAETTKARRKLSNDFLSRAILHFLGLSVLAVIIIWIAISKSLHPLALLQQAIDRRSPDELHSINHRVPDEVGGADGYNQQFHEQA